MSRIHQQKGFADTALTFAFSPVILGFLIGALPLLVPMLVVRGAARLVHAERPAA